MLAESALMRNLPCLCGMLSLMARLMGIDYGEKRVGIAFSDERGIIAQPAEVLANTDQLIPQLIKRANDADVTAIIIGESKNYAGADNPIQRRARASAEALQDAGYEVLWQSEALTTQQARRSRVRKGRKARDERPLDAQSAALLLQSFIDKQHHEHV